MEIKINPESYDRHLQWFYTWKKCWGKEEHTILIPNLTWLKSRPKLRKKVLKDLDRFLIRDLNHEILHLILHEFISYKAMANLDNIDLERNAFES